MKKTISFLLLAAMLSSCGVFRDVTKNKDVENAKTVVKTDSSVKVSTGKVDKGVTVTNDQSVTITERESTRTVTRPGADVAFRADMIRLQNGEKITMDSGAIRISMWLNALSNSLNVSVAAPDETETENTKERTTQNKDISTEENRDLEESSTEEVAISSSQESKSKTKTKAVEKEGKNAFWFVVAIAVVVLIVVYFVYLRTKIKR